jgi:hypothetical protein
MKNRLHKMYSPQGCLHHRVPSNLVEKYLSEGWTMYEETPVEETKVSEEETQLTLDINEEND